MDRAFTFVLIVTCFLFTLFLSVHASGNSSNETARQQKDDRPFLPWHIPYSFKNDNCSIGKVYIEEDDKCLLQKRLTQPCRHTKQCTGITRNSQCDYISDDDDIKKCICPKTHFSNERDNCFPKKLCSLPNTSGNLFLKDANPHQGNCSTNEICLSGFCWCPKGYYWNHNYQCVPVSRDVHQMMTSPSPSPSTSSSPKTITTTITTTRTNSPKQTTKPTPKSISPDSELVRNEYEKLKVEHAKLKHQINQDQLTRQQQNSTHETKIIITKCPESNFHIGLIYGIFGSTIVLAMIIAALIVAVVLCDRFGKLKISVKRKGDKTKKQCNEVELKLIKNKGDPTNS